MKFQKVESSNLEAVGYDTVTKLLGVQFKGGGIYLYYGVPEGKHAALMASESVGSFFNTQVKPNYIAVKIEPYITPVVIKETKVLGDIVAATLVDSTIGVKKEDVVPNAQTPQ